VSEARDDDDTRSADRAQAGRLYLVPTPLGHPGDLSPRAVETLRSVDVIAAEDTRTVGKLLRSLDIHTRMVSYHDHSERQRAPALLDDLLRGASVALVSEAGTPLLADPGFRLLALAIEHGVAVCSLPGPSAALTALVGSGLPVSSFLFLPRRSGPRSAALRAVAGLPHTLVLFEAPHRILAALDDLAAELGERRAAIGWNLTRDNERFYRGTLSALRSEIAAWPYPHGQMTLVVEGAAEASLDEPWARAERAIRLLLAQGVEPRVLRDAVVELSDLPRRELYQRILALRESEPG
jgi:16S rRNA (cytidine1402-2'-O)-methyltransferase